VRVERLPAWQGGLPQDAIRGSNNRRYDKEGGRSHALGGESDRRARVAGKNPMRNGKKSGWLPLGSGYLVTVFSGSVWSNRLAVTTGGGHTDERSRAPTAIPIPVTSANMNLSAKSPALISNPGFFASVCCSCLTAFLRWASAGPLGPKSGPLDTNQAGPLLGPCQPVRIENDCPAAEQKRQRGMKEIRPKRALSFTDEGYTVRGCGTS